jgi:cysteinyl-tRNA synthetase
MVVMIEDLIARGHAYAKEGHVLFRVRSYEAYGKLSGRSVDDMIAGARVEVAPFKEDPMDFVLWKPSSGDQPGWESPWGFGRPGWHIECSAMAYELLGESFDIHGGGNDLMFPHHENEIAQSCCAHPEGGFAQVWMHNEMLQVEGKKMSKSLGNFFTVRDLLDQGVPGEVIRFVFLSTHYRKPMDWTAEKAREAEKTLTMWKRLVDEGRDDVRHKMAEADLPKVIVDALSDDLNTPLAITHLHALAKQAKASWDGKVALAKAMLFFEFDPFQPWDHSFGTSLNKSLEDPVSFEYFERLLFNARKLAMETKDFAETDRIKNALLEAGCEVRISKSEVTIDATDNFDPSKLKALR